MIALFIFVTYGYTTVQGILVNFADVAETIVINACQTQNNNDI